jgi:hypothetical protein
LEPPPPSNRQPNGTLTENLLQMLQCCNMEILENVEPP